ncbi:molybdate ABC transporter substrate-binding protein [Paenibacillus glycanilyticus]|uniref:Molybdate ABC transporter substrate-binding protein n=1 Tax=Paenibacillus glycanilyticus TaxID=126569 RepID=A0ABQ6GB75_9BACL|nr:molybdate ABC transporter substrate-binding protein [Paenibacillus glycanilyticus]GLX67887.1 molybdate ABC transporter substrate-binding protein [Paenibacillus glycanilyticus]
MRNKVKNSMVLLSFALMILFTAACGNNANNANNAAAVDTKTKVDLTISAAASLTDALTEIQKAYEEKNPEVKLQFNFGASGALQQQIEQGAPADLFLSAAAKNLKALVDKQLIETDKQTNLLGNELVVVVPADSKLAVASEADLTKEDVKHVAVGIPESVPAGNYAKESLTNAKLWDSLQTKAVQAKDVRQVLQYVETGNADAGFVYKTDALTSDKVKIAFTVDSATYTPITYPIGVVKATKHSKEAEDFYSYLQSQEALDVFVKYGFSVPAK